MSDALALVKLDNPPQKQRGLILILMLAPLALVELDHTPTATGHAANTFPTRDNKDENVLFRDVPKMAKMIIPEWFQEQTNASEVRWDKGEVKYPLHLVNGTYQGLHQEVNVRATVDTFCVKDRCQ